jgi:hypothetical protein
MHVPVLDVRILRNETFYPYESHAMKSLDMVVVKSHVNRGPIMLRMKWPDGGYTRIPTVVVISEIPPSPNYPSEPIIHHHHASSQSGKRPLNPQFGDSREACCSLSKTSRLLFK